MSPEKATSGGAAAGWTGGGTAAVCDGADRASGADTAQGIASGADSAGDTASGADSAGDTASGADSTGDTASGADSAQGIASGAETPDGHQTRRRREAALTAPRRRMRFHVGEDDLVLLPPGLSVVARPHAGVQCGVLPQGAVVIPVPEGVNAGHVAHIISQARRLTPVSTVVTGLTYCGIDEPDAVGIVGELIDVGVLIPDATADPPLAVLHTGRLSADVAGALARDGVDTVSVTDLHPQPDASEPVAGILLLAGMLFPPADVAYALMDRRIIHYPCGIVDGRVCLGPLVIPGATACLACVDASHQRQDGLWRGIRVQAATRPAGVTENLSTLLSSATSLFATQTLLPWWNSLPVELRSGAATARAWQEVAGALPQPLRERITVDPSGWGTHRSEVTPEPQCPGCALAGPPPARPHRSAHSAARV